ncbi:AraC family transcriptional regulator [Shewanella hanedai]|uniref:AraC family transcriptional regulator n=1 Tax=Shewanella hanedai TaxID=25 RepID=A0A553JRM2_SHEHA|nr:AraC family transcriptional regulator [Shewanella hanedai]TRY15099.1 AraC family transcriptional regulator [Shewanella hanedai]GGI74721.1 AraC family transcriptional regulator [Shewanella hanedai]
MAEYYSTLSGWIIPFTRAMDVCGIETDEAFIQCGIDPNSVKDPEARIGTQRFVELLDYCNKLRGTGDFSIQVGECFHPGMFHALGYAMMTSSTLKDALARIVTYKRVVSNACTLELSETNESLVLKMMVSTFDTTGRKVLSRAATETFMAIVVKFTRELLGINFHPQKLIIGYDKPADYSEYLSTFFNCDVEFSDGDSYLFFEKVHAEKYLTVANPMINGIHEKMLTDFLSRIDRHDLTYVIKNKIYEILPLGAPSQQEIAEKLGMSLRNLQRKLQEQDTCYKTILEDTRKSLTLDYIKQAHLSLSEIGYLVGFSSVGNFNRAFKRWTNSTPGEYRRQYISKK